MITWSRLAGMKLCPALPESRECYKLFVKHIMWLHVKSFIPTTRDSSFVLPRFRFAGTKFSYVIPLAHLSGMKKIFNTCFQNVSLKKSISAHFLDISILFLRRIWRQSVRKKYQCLYRISSFYEKRMDTAED